MSKWLAIAVIFICSCTSSKEGKRLVNSRFGVCINLPPGADYSNYNQFVDYDTAVIHINGTAIEVVIGGHPQFSQNTIKKVTRAVDGFMLLGEEREEGKDKMLFGINRQNDPVPGFYGPENELVTFASEDLKSIRHLLLRRNVVIDCRKPA